MAKVTVILNCKFDNGKDVKLPGETTSLEEKEARALADMGMVIIEGAASKPSSKKKKPDASGTGGESGGEGDDDGGDGSEDGGGNG